MTQVTAQWQVSSKKIRSKIKSGGGRGGGFKCFGIMNLDLQGKYSQDTGRLVRLKKCHDVA